MKMTFSLLISLLLIGCGNTENKTEDQPIKIQQGGQQTSLEDSMARGVVLYEDFCIQCHMPNGQGVTGTFPPLAGSNWLTEKRTASIHSVKFGQQGKIEVNGVTYNGIMTRMGLSDDEVADVLNYVMNSWGNTQSEMVTPQEVAQVEK
ncbi:c-type cytochrome [Aureitalea marina]|uniref:Cytochrome C n=1 Tax=Aureitalea marina TaxID=930804 RepID=A0A2S7KPY9_9FLAO|nr:cytochrome c [Aureitalea marina]PQB04680.1 cytochrome C [Aureitalea marina]